MFTKLKTIALALALAGCASQPITSSITTERALAADQQNYLTRNVQDDVFYFVLPDRFHNGDASNDLGSNTIALSRGGFDKTNKGAYHGGDIRGLEQKLDYIKGMGVTAIWLTPILRNQAVQSGVSGYHGYWVLDFSEIDPHLGSNADLKSLIDAAHQKGLKVFFDIITNHTADVIKLAECHGADGAGWSTQSKPCPYKSLAQKAAGDNYTTVIPQGSEQVKSPAWLNDPKYYHNQGDSTFVGEDSLYGDFFGLDDLDTDNPEVVSGMIDIFRNIVDEFKPDGFRVDTVKHVNMEFWSQFSPAIVEHAKSIGIPQFFMFGEVYSGDADVLSSFTTTGKLQSVLDFGFQGAIYQSIVAGKGNRQLKTLFDNDVKYADNDSNANQLLNFVGNHDMGRIGYHLNNSEFNHSQADKAKRSKLAHALMFFARGIPVIYYGDEQGFVGDGGDHDARQDMMPSQVASFNDDDLLASDNTTANDNFDQSHPLYQAFKSYSDIYRQHPALRYGEQHTIFADDKPGLFTFSRTLVKSAHGEVQRYLVVFNTATTAKSVSLAVDKDYQPIYVGKDNVLNGHELTVAGLDFAIYRVE